MSAAGLRLWVFGGGMALPSTGRDNTFLALEAGRGCWLIDCGSAPYRRLLEVGVSPLALRGIILTHAHADHIYGLPVLLFQLSLAGYAGVLPIYGLGETLRVGRQVVQAFELGEHCVEHDWRVIEPGQGDLADAVVEEGVRIRLGRVDHSGPAVGVRIEGPEGGALAYSGDSGPCGGVVWLARGAAWLLHECSVDRPAMGHSSPEDVGRTAVLAGVERLGIVHYDPGYVTGEEELVARVRSVGYEGVVCVLGDKEAIAS